MRVICLIIAYRVFRSTAFAANEKNQYGVTRPDLTFAGLGQVYVKTMQKRSNAENQPKISHVSRESRGLLGFRRDIETVSLNHTKNQRKVGHEGHRA